MSPAPPGVPGRGGNGGGSRALSEWPRAKGQSLSLTVVPDAGPGSGPGGHVCHHHVPALQHLTLRCDRSENGGWMRVTASAVWLVTPAVEE